MLNEIIDHMCVEKVHDRDGIITALKMSKPYCKVVGLDVQDSYLQRLSLLNSWDPNLMVKAHIGQEFK